MAYCKAKLKSSGDKASPSFRPFWIGKLTDKWPSELIMLFLKNLCFSHFVQRCTFSTSEPASFA
jgi:hypothetical protein